MLNRIFSILSAHWLIHQDSAISYLPVLLAFINGKEILQTTEENKPSVVAFAGQGEQVNAVTWWRLDDPDIPDNSVAVLQMDGPMKSWDYSRLMNWLRDVESNQKIVSVLLVVNSPGGMVQQLDSVAGMIKTMRKPVVSMVSGMAASAAMWLISATAYRIATSRMDVLGSIGTKTSIQDYSKLMEKIGIKITDFYSTKSTRKDEEYRPSRRATASRSRTMSIRSTNFSMKPSVPTWGSPPSRRSSPAPPSLPNRPKSWG